jgi:hypothetical protein
MFSSATNKLPPAVEDSTAVYVVGSDTESIYNADDPSTWDDERGIVALRKFYNLKDEAHTTVQESQRTWIDTPFSLYALQSESIHILIQSFILRSSQLSTLPVNPRP